MEDDKVTTIYLCGVQGCCPVVKIYPNEVIISDDNDGKVTLTRAQWNALKEIQA